MNSAILDDNYMDAIAGEIKDCKRAIRSTSDKHKKTQLSSQLEASVREMKQLCLDLLGED